MPKSWMGPRYTDTGGVAYHHSASRFARADPSGPTPAPSVEYAATTFPLRVRSCWPLAVTRLLAARCGTESLGTWMTPSPPYVSARRISRSPSASTGSRTPLISSAASWRISSCEPWGSASTWVSAARCGYTVPAGTWEVSPVQNTRSTARASPFVRAAVARFSRRARSLPHPTGEHDSSAYTQNACAAHVVTPSWDASPVTGPVLHGSSSPENTGPHGSPSRWAPISHRSTTSTGGAAENRP